MHEDKELSWMQKCPCCSEREEKDVYFDLREGKCPICGWSIDGSR